MMIISTGHTNCLTIAETDRAYSHSCKMCPCGRAIISVVVSSQLSIFRRPNRLSVLVHFVDVSDSVGVLVRI